MADCELIEKCIAFYDKMGNKPATAKMMKKAYCQGRNTECARFQVYTVHGRENIPPDLFPHEVSRVKSIIN